jgi:flagellar biosynthesis protein
LSDNSSSSDSKKPVAVALQYAPEQKDAPEIVATGRGAVAERICELAAAHGVPIRKDADLAEILAAVEIGEEIPVAAFAAVAEILFYILEANRHAPVASERLP